MHPTAAAAAADRRSSARTYMSCMQGAIPCVWGGIVSDLALPYLTNLPSPPPAKVGIYICTHMAVGSRWDSRRRDREDGWMGWVDERMDGCDVIDALALRCQLRCDCNFTPPCQPAAKAYVRYIINHMPYSIRVTYTHTHITYTCQHTRLLRMRVQHPRSRCMLLSFSHIPTLAQCPLNGSMYPTPGPGGANHPFCPFRSPVDLHACMT